MTAYTLGQKAEATIRLLMGMRLPSIQRKLEPHGFDAAVLEDGYARLRALGFSRQLGAVRLPEPEYGRVAALEEFCREWFPIGRIALSNRYPDVGEKLFEGLRQPKGIVAIGVAAVFLDRLDALAAGDPVYGPEALPAFAFLGRRGLTPAAIEALRDRLEDFTRAESTPPEVAESLAREARALEHLWGWYLEWSTIARRSVTARQHRQALGFER